MNRVTETILRYFYWLERLAAAPSATGPQTERLALGMPAHDGPRGGANDRAHLAFADAARPMRSLPRDAIELLRARYWATDGWREGERREAAGYLVGVRVPRFLSYEQVARVCGLRSAQAARYAVQRLRIRIASAIDEVEHVGR